MNAVFSDWYNHNELRNYPLADGASRISKSGHEMPMDVLVDMSIRYPETLRGTPFLSAAAVTPNLASIVISLSVDGGGEVVLGVVTAVGPVQYRHYKVDPYQPGVGGWVVFGAAVRETNDFRLQFEPSAGKLIPKAARTYPVPPLSSIYRKDRATKLTGDTALNGSGLIEVFVADEPWTVTPDYDNYPRRMRLVDGVQVPAVIVQMRRDAAYDELGQYLGQCVDATTEGCDPPPIQMLNRVKPDENGNIEVEIKGIPFTVMVSEVGEPEGLALESPLGIIDICDPNKSLDPKPQPEPDCDP